MRSTSLSTLLIVSIVAFSLISCGGASSGGADGAGGANKPITCRQDGFTVISDIDGLKAIGDDQASMAKNYCLTANIDLASATGADSGFPLGWDAVEADITPFIGNFDGEGHTISNLVIDNSAGENMGLFAIIEPGTGKSSEIKDLTLNNFNITAQKRAGALVGEIKGKVTILRLRVNNVTVNGTQLLGGLVGEIGEGEGAKIIGSFVNGGTVASTKNDNHIGGLVGQITLGGIISNSYAKVDVSGTTNIGGLVGFIIQKGEILNSYATGKVIANATQSPARGGLVGQINGCSTNDCIITNSYFDLDANRGIKAIGTGTATTTGLVGVVGAGDIEESAGGGFQTKASPNSKIFVDWSTNAWQTEVGKWPVFKKGQCQQFGWKEIKDVAGLKEIGENTASMAKNYCLTANIDLASATGADSGFPLGWTSNSSINAFTGNLDGEGHTISNLVIDNDAGNYMGLFAEIIPETGKSSEIKNLTLNAFDLTGLTHVGALAGDIGGSVIISKVIAQEVKIIGKGTQTAHIGGLLGDTSGAIKIMDSSATGDVTGEGHNIGGLVGLIGNKGMISNSYAAVTVVGKGDKIGGLIGESGSGVKISNSYSTGNVKGNDKVGGLAGRIDGDSSPGYYATISNSYATGDVEGNDFLGGLIGHGDGIKVSNNYSTGNVKGNDKVGGFIGSMLPNNEVSNSYSTGEVEAIGTDKGIFIGRLDVCINVKCKITNSYFDKSGANRAINPIGSGGDTATITGVVGVVGAGDIEESAGDGFQTKASPNRKIFVGWDATIWQIMAGEWPTFK